MEFRGADFVKKVQIKQEAEELKHRLEELEYESKVRDDIDDEYISPSTATQTGESTSTMASNSIEDDDLPF